MHNRMDYYRCDQHWRMDYYRCDQHGRMDQYFKNGDIFEMHEKSDWTLYDTVEYLIYNKRYDEAVRLFNKYNKTINSTLFEEMYSYMNQNTSSLRYGDCMMMMLNLDIMDIILKYRSYLRPFNYLVDNHKTAYAIDKTYHATDVKLDEYSQDLLDSIDYVENWKYIIYFVDIKAIPRYIKQVKASCERDLILFNFFTPVDGDYVIRGKIKEFLNELHIIIVKESYNR